MITVKRLKKLIKHLPDKAEVSVYEGERIGIEIEDIGKKGSGKYWWIDATEKEEEDTYTEGFNKEKK